MNIAQFPGGSTLNYRTENPPTTWNERQAYDSGQELDSKASRTRDFFQSVDGAQSDNAYDLDPRQGYVRLKDTFAPGLLEQNTVSVSGYFTPDGDGWATGVETNYGAESTLVVSNQGKEVFMDRPVYVNNRYLPTVESLTYEADGSRTFSEAYTRWENN